MGVVVVTGVVPSPPEVPTKPALLVKAVPSAGWQGGGRRLCSCAQQATDAVRLPQHHLQG
jgi:hypothetical protein